jgi:large subunit ribosomal protein L19
MSSLLSTLIPESKPGVEQLRPGDTVRVFNRIVEGSQERVQVFQGTVMRLSGKGGLARFTVRRIAAHGVRVERTFSAGSPRLEKVEVVRSAHIRRAKLYYLRGRTGKSARLRGKRYLGAAEAVSAEPEATNEGSQK